jgi:acetyl esterase/lipase
MKTFLRFGATFAVVLALPFFSPAQTTGVATKVPAVSHQADGIDVQNDIIFGEGGGHPLHADLAWPTNERKPLPAVIYIHGGGWIGGSYKGGPIVGLAQAGYFAASIEYRLSDVAKWPAQLEDCQLAVRWLRANAAKYNVDPNRIGVWGESAGGHLVACLGTMGDVKQPGDDNGYPGVSDAVQAVVDFYGPTDFVDPGKYTPQAIDLTEKLFGVPQAQNSQLWKSGSPLFFVKPGDPPFLLVHGDSDGLVPLAQSTVFDEALTKAGVPHQLLVVKNADHGFRPIPGTTISPNGNEIIEAVHGFFDKYLKAP